MATYIDALLERIRSLESKLAFYKGEVLPKVVVNDGQSVIAVGRKGRHLAALRIGNYWTSSASFEPWMTTAPPVPYDPSRYLSINEYFDKEEGDG